VLQVVAAENFWGSLVSQMGGSHVTVTSIVSDPNADPHEYESNTANAVAISNANYVILNGLGYDAWAQKLLDAANKDPNRAVLNVQQLIGLPDGSNPHMWYNPTYVNKTVARMYADLVGLDPNDASYFQQQYATLNQSFAKVWNRLGVIHAKFPGQNVSATEDIFVYLANATGLNLISPPEFMEAVAEGNDPPADSVKTFQDQLTSNMTTLLVYNQQTVTPTTQQLKAIAAQNNIPIVGVTETIQPPDASFEDWMSAQLIALQNGLNANALGQ
jgi:zinc/manganese transport system substrate-binding protein